ncbi:hypothetical protein ATY81_14010 [Rhizobium sp. R72]|uniref:DUF1134 domain-containing protein n=1 Tax=unclassified Rhizobium TaxID=2613769 RepID=UPI000B529638|nr:MULTISPECIES: EipA family protein [unclassified Rhizobium]OWV82829.1 hypothetical protein ATY79_15685 [Rhizobium sp. R693]OWV93732.1 hypothetical protein ATY81_14010 [Rhizobium sp. R72]OWV93970.1 hypothetical protein ATY80_14010 [Rhizobium sp. R711]
MRSHFLGRFSAICRLFVALTLSPLILVPTKATAQQQSNGGQYSMQEIVDAGHSFFGSTSGGLAKVIEAAFQKYGLPNGYILGQEGSGAFIAGLTYGEGQLNTKNAGEHPLYWQGPSLGIDYGGQGTRVMMLVYDLPSTDAIYARFGGVSGQAFVIAGFGMTLLKNDNVLVVPIRTGVGARLGLNVGYLKVTPNPTWNPF